ncbi:trigger factor [bacterium]|nr:trigger factor [bacterium]
MIKVDIKEKNETTRILDVTVPQETVDQQFAQALHQVQKKAELPGFRKGKVPQDIVEKKYAYEIRETVLDQLFNESYKQALEQTKCVPIQQPKLEKMDLEKGKPLVYQVMVDVLPKVKLGDYKGLKLKQKKNEVKSQEVDDVVNRLREQSAVLEPVEDRPVASGDVVTIDFEGKKDGELVPGTKAEAHTVETGKGQTIPDFEKNIIGMQLNETKTFAADFPEDYHAKEMAGQSIDFTVTAKAIQSKKLSELNDDFAKQMGKFDTLEALRKRIEEDLVAEKEKQNRTLFTDQIMQQLSKSTQVKVPAVLIERSLKNLWKDHENRLARQNQTVEQGGITEEDFNKKNSSQVEIELKARLALREIGILETIEVTDSDVDGEIDQMALGMRQSPEVIRNWVEKNNSWEDIRDRLRDKKTQDFIIASAKISIS